MARAALWYAQRGAHVFACGVRAKAPATARGCHDATTDAHAIERMWRNPMHNVAIACGPSGLVVVDVDGLEGVRSLDALCVKYEALPTTATVCTSPNAAHYYFTHDHTAARIGNSSGALGLKLDTRGDGGYVLAPPSIHPKGHGYRWAPGRGPHEIALAPLPAWLRELLIERPIERSDTPISLPPARGRERSYARAALESECREVQTAPEGTRNARLNIAAFSVGQLVGSGWLDDRLARGALIAAGVAAGLWQLESIKTVNSGLSAGMRQPRQLAERRAANE